MRTTWPAILIAALVVLLTTGCASVSVNQDHPELEKDPNQPAAAVYFIRTSPVKNKGVADSPVRITYQGKDLVTLDEGTNTLLYLKPSTGMMRLHSRTLFIGQQSIKEVWRERNFRFITGKTYFIHVRQDNEEFRGVFYTPELVNLEEAKRLARDTRTKGLASSHPIAKLTSVEEPPPGSADAEPPALPEQLYHPEKYMQKKNPFK